MKPYDDHFMFRDYADKLAQFKDKIRNKYGMSTAAFLRKVVGAVIDDRLTIELSDGEKELHK